MNDWILTLITFVPIVFVIILLLPMWQTPQFKIIATVGAAIDLVLSLLLLPF